MKASTEVQFPGFRDEVRELVDQHRQLKDEPLLLAVYYAPERRPEDVFLFEVAENFGANDVHPEREIFEIEFGMDLKPMTNGDGHVHLVITNPHELEVASREDWGAVRELRNALANKRGEIVYEGPGGDRLLELVSG